jgi:hypothetical protein
VVGAAALAAGIAFGVGGREVAGEIVRDWYSRSQQKRAVQEDRTVTENASGENSI